MDERKNLPDYETLNTNPEGIAQARFTEKKLLNRSVAEIAQALKLSPNTVGTHLYRIKQKLGATNQAELTLLAVRWGLIEP